MSKKQSEYNRSPAGKEGNRKCYQKYRTQRIEKVRQRRRTLRGYLRIRFNDMKRRCEDSKDNVYKYYGKKNIKVLFESFEDFYNYVVEVFDIKTVAQIKGLVFHRKNVNGHYAPGNLELLSQSEHMKLHHRLRRAV